MSEQSRIDRRAFLARLPVLPGAAAGLAGVASAACASVPYATARLEEHGLVVAASAFGAGNELFVDVAGERFPLYVRRATDGSYTAVSLRCTHRGCRPEPEADRLACPCHGSEFGFDGRVLQGPAETPLASYLVEVEGANLLIGRSPAGVSGR